MVSGKVGNRIFVLLADTKSSIANFIPSSKLDASYRPDGPDLDVKNLFHPYILLLTHDVLKDSQVDFRDDWSFVNCGRPLWKSLYPNPSESSPEMLEYAANKLRQSTDENVSDELAVLAVVICRTGVYVSPQSSTTSDLAANYMATLLLSDCTHEHFLVTYLSDPVLTIAKCAVVVPERFSSGAWVANFAATIGSWRCFGRLLG